MNPFELVSSLHLLHLKMFEMTSYMPRQREMSTGHLKKPKQTTEQIQKNQSWYSKIGYRSKNLKCSVICKCTVGWKPLQGRFYIKVDQMLFVHTVHCLYIYWVLSCSLVDCNGTMRKPTNLLWQSIWKRRFHQLMWFLSLLLVSLMQWPFCIK